MSEITKEDVIKFIEGMNVLELSELVKELEEKFGVSAVAPAFLGATPNVAEAKEQEVEAEQTEFDVVLKAIGDKKIQVIKAVREITGLGLKESKDVVDSIPKAVKEKVSKEDAESIKSKLEEAGAQVEIK